MEDESKLVEGNRLFILPLIHIDGERYMCQKMNNIVAIFTNIGHLDIFSAITSTLSWPYITRALMLGQTPNNKPDLAFRVSMINLQAMMSYIINEKLFGRIAVYLRLAELQKQRFRHTYCIIFLGRAQKELLERPEPVN